MAVSISIEAQLHRMCRFPASFITTLKRIAPIRWNRTFLTYVNLLKRGPTSGGVPMAPISASDAFLTVAIMSVTFLIEVGFFALVGLF
jgi:hypothetical protein